MKFAVAQTNSVDNDLTVEIIIADDWKQAIVAHSAFNDPEYKLAYDEWFEDLPNELTAAKAYFFDGDILIDVVEIPLCGADGL